MTRIGGRIIERESRAGIADLQVIVVLASDQERGTSLGADVTDHDGSFAIDVGAALRNDASPAAVSVVVHGPDRGDSADPLHNTGPMRVASGAVQKLLIELSPGVLRANDIAGPGQTQPAAKIVANIRSRAEQVSLVEKQWATVARQRVAAHSAQLDGFRETFLPGLMRDISTLSGEPSQAKFLSTDHDPDRSVAKLSRLAATEGATRISAPLSEASGSARRTRYFLTPPQRQLLDDLLAADADQTLSAAEMESVLRLGERIGDQARPTQLTREEAAFGSFLTQTFDERCATEILHGTQVEPEGPTNPGEVPDPTDLVQLVERVTADIDAPISQLAGRPGQGDVIGSIRDFALPPGPADTPAYFDFQKLNIAFDHVWKEFLDARIEPLAQQAYGSVMALGGDEGAVLDRDRGAVEALAAQADLIGAAGIATMPETLYRQSLHTPTAQRGLGVGGNLFRGPDPIIDPGDHPPPPPLPLPGDDDDLRDRLGISTAPTNDRAARPPPSTVIGALRSILRGRYAFTAFGADHQNSAVNFGVTVTYRQRWEPVTYQVGELIRTITLAPGETRKFTKRTKVTRKRAEKEVRKNSTIRSDEFDTTTRAESEIVRKARTKTNFSVTADGTYNFGVASGDSTTTADHDAEGVSDQTKKSFREAVMKASQEFKQERTLEVATESLFETEETEIGEIGNPNTELTVTYLFYELQRRFRMSEQINEATPVMLVAQDLPSPDSIDEAFLIRHGWILKRAILDDKYEPVLAYVSGPLAGDKVARAALYRAMEDHRRLVDKLKDDLYAMKEQASRGYEALRRAVEARINAESVEETDGLLVDFTEFFVGGGQDSEALRMREEAARNHEQRAVEQTKQLAMALQREVSAYADATDKYTRAHKTFKEWELRVVDLLVHVKDNIIHYMHAIWAHEHPDQRFLRLHTKTAPGFTPSNGGARFQFAGEPGLTRSTLDVDGNPVQSEAVEFLYFPDFEVEPDAKTLSQIADLDSLLGFKGNYMIFPLRESNPLTDYLLEPYVDAGFRLLDPDERGNISREDFARYVCHLRETLDDAAFEAMRPDLLARFERLLLSGPGNGDEIIVPTGSAYIEALPGANPLLEDFMLAHRAMDVLEAQEGVRRESLDNIRRAGRILADDLGDPDVDVRYEIDGVGPVHIGTPSIPAGGTPVVDD